MQRLRSAGFVPYACEEGPGLRLRLAGGRALQVLSSAARRLSESETFRLRVLDADECVTGSRDDVSVDDILVEADRSAEFPKP